MHHLRELERMSTDVHTDYSCPDIGNLQYEVTEEGVSARLWIQTGGQMVSIPVGVPHVCLLMEQGAKFLSLYHCYASRQS